MRHRHEEAQQLQAGELEQLLEMILRGMRLHEDPYIQARGCHCLALVLTARDQLKCGRLIHLPQDCDRRRPFKKPPGRAL